MSRPPWIGIRLSSQNTVINNRGLHSAAPLSRVTGDVREKHSTYAGGCTQPPPYRVLPVKLDKSTRPMQGAATSRPLYCMLLIVARYTILRIILWLSLLTGSVTVKVTVPVLFSIVTFPSLTVA